MEDILKKADENLSEDHPVGDHGAGFSGAGKVMVILATAAIAIWATIWIGRCFFWLITLMLAGVIIMLETACHKFKQIVLGQ